jgi:hypothetical protein
MNFFGHAVAAAWREPSPTFALGAMLPDWVGMCGARLIAAPAAGSLADGIAFHHATDQAFHALPGFRALEQRAIAALGAAGLPRGPARGAAHVAVELLLDGVLVEREPAAGPLYLAALDAAPAHGAVHGDDPRMATLVARLGGQGLPLAYRDPSQVARRTAFALARRPRLALDDDGQRRLADELPALAAAVESAATELMADLRSRLGA